LGEERLEAAALTAALGRKKVFWAVEEA